jgi:hypothetical protein
MGCYSALVAVGVDTGDGEGDMEFKLFFMIWLALNVSTFLPTMMISSPV